VNTFGHYRLMGWFLRQVVGSAKKTFQISIVPEAEREQWLYDHWKLLDEWISATAGDQQ